MEKKLKISGFGQGRFLDKPKPTKATFSNIKKLEKYLSKPNEINN